MPSHTTSPDAGSVIAEVCRYRQLLLSLIMRDVRVRYKQSLLGAAACLGRASVGHQGVGGHCEYFVPQKQREQVTRESSTHGAGGLGIARRPRTPCGDQQAICYTA